MAHGMDVFGPSGKGVICTIVNNLFWRQTHTHKHVNIKKLVRFPFGFYFVAKFLYLHSDNKTWWNRIAKVEEIAKASICAHYLLKGEREV